MKWQSWIFAACAVLCLMGAAARAEGSGAIEENVPLPIEVPRPSFGGTPLDYWSEHLEPPSFRKRKPFLVPRGTKNVSFGKTVTSSAQETLTGALSAIVDGEKGYEESHVVELPPGPQWVQLDLGDTYEVYAIVVWHYHAADRVYFDVIVQAGRDKDFKKGVTTLYNTDYDNSTGQGIGEDREYIENFQGRLVPAKGVHARFVRLFTNGNTSDDNNHYIEVEVWGRPLVQ